MNRSFTLLSESNYPSPYLWLTPRDMRLGTECSRRDDVWLAQEKQLPLAVWHPLFPLEEASFHAVQAHNQH